MMSTGQITNALEAEFKTLNFMRDSFPMLTDWAVRDESILVHSLGCNYLAALGRNLGFWAINEFPVRVPSEKTVRPDAVWWTRPDRKVRFIAEFERYTPGQEKKLTEKTCNLVETCQTLHGTPVVALLLGWAMAGTDLAEAAKASAAAFSGFRNQNGDWVPGLCSDHKFLQAFAIFGQQGRHIKVLRVQK
jgi:hypothetical protein